MGRTEDLINSLVKTPCHKTPYRRLHRLSLSSQSSRSWAGLKIKVLKDKGLEFANSIPPFIALSTRFDVTQNGWILGITGSNFPQGPGSSVTVCNCASGVNPGPTFCTCADQSTPFSFPLSVQPDANKQFYTETGITCLTSPQTTYQVRGTTGSGRISNVANKAC
jgi:hypothetical protein